MPSLRISGAITRFAPSPTGYLHLGHAYAALKAWQGAEADGFILRIEDLDRSRCRPQYVEGIFEDLRWLGLRWREPVLYQSSRSAAYGEALAALRHRGLCYPCFCTRTSLAAARSPQPVQPMADIALAAQAPHPASEPLPVYPGTCRALSEAQCQRRLERGEAHAWRLDAARAAREPAAADLYFIEQGERQGERLGEQPARIAVQPLLFGDVVLARKDLPAAYHLAVVLDDAWQGISVVTRGEDLLPATHVQRLLQALLDLPAPRYAHHRLILDAQGRKFSKRDQSLTLRALRRQGITPRQLQQRLGLTPA
jgi:glutamyl-Q tRNA(Asp) synthetase